MIRVIGQDWFNLPLRFPRKKVQLSKPKLGGDHIIAGIPGKSIETPEDVDREVSISGSSGEERSVASALLSGAGGTLFPTAVLMSPFWNCFKLWDYEELLIRSAESPELVRYACGCYLTTAKKEIRNAAALGVRGIWLEECLTDLLHPDVYAALSLPYARAMVEEIRGAGLKSIYYFTGNPRGKLNYILSAGADAFAFEEKKKGFATVISDLSEFFSGKASLLGNIDPIAILQNGDEEDLKAALREQIQAAKIMNGRFIMSLGSPVTPATPLKKVKSYVTMAGI